jgi:hypothetical protein
MLRMAVNCQVTPKSLRSLRKGLEGSPAKSAQI